MMRTDLIPAQQPVLYGEVLDPLPEPVLSIPFSLRPDGYVARAATEFADLVNAALRAKQSGG